MSTPILLHDQVHALRNGLTSPAFREREKLLGMLCFLQKTLMLAELAQWITPAIFILGFLYLDRSIRTVRTESCQGMKDLRQEMKDMRVEIVNLRNRMDEQNEALRDRLDTQNEVLRDRFGRIEGPLDVLRDFFVHNGRGTAA